MSGNKQKSRMWKGIQHFSEASSKITNLNCLQHPYLELARTRFNSIFFATRQTTKKLIITYKPKERLSIAILDVKNVVQVEVKPTVIKIIRKAMHYYSTLNINNSQTQKGKKLCMGYIRKHGSHYISHISYSVVINPLMYSQQMKV